MVQPGYVLAVFAAIACRKSRAPQVMAYWLTSASIAALAASLSSGGQEKSGKPWERLIPSCCRHRRVISRITDSVKVSAFALMRCAIAAGDGAGVGAGEMLTPPSCRLPIRDRRCGGAPRPARPRRPEYGGSHGRAHRPPPGRAGPVAGGASGGGDVGSRRGRPRTPTPGPG